MLSITLLDLFKFLVFICGLIDSHKYFRQSQKIIRKKTSTSQSRMFLNEALVVDFVLLAYIVIFYPSDYLLLTIRTLPIITTLHLYWVTYIYYPYKCRKLQNFKRPSLWKFIINSLQPNNKAKRL